jgi:cold shock CspA family protein
MPDYNDFIHSDFNVMLNNVSTSLYSISRKTLEISGSSQIIGSGSFPLLVTASLQDSYLSLSAYTLPRYSGSKTYSAKYNSYTDGDKSYGKTAAIDRYVRKFGLFTQVVSSSFFDSRNLVALKYLVDESGSLTELSQTPTSSIDSNWSEVQNTFKLGSTPTVALFDNQQYGDQKKTDGPKSIFDSGYSYYPTLYYSTGSTKLYFQYVGVGTSILFRSDNVLPNSNGFINGGSTNPYTPNNGFIYNVFDNFDGTFEGRNYYKIGSNNNFPSYSVSQNITMDFSANFGINIQFGSFPQSASYTFSMISGSTTLASETKTFTSTLGNLSSVLDFNVTSSYTNFNPGDKIFFRLQQITSSNNYTASLLSTGDLTPYTGLKNTISTATTGINPFATSSAAPFISSSNGTDTLFLNESLSSFKDYLFLSQTSSADLHTTYGNIDYTFSPKVGDVILLYYNNSTQVQELNVVTAGIIPNGSVFAIKVSPNLVSTLSVSSYTSSTINKLLLLSKIPDETNINLVFDKEDGTTSYGFIIPDNLSPDVLKNIDTITRNVKAKILSTNQGITINTV